MSAKELVLYTLLYFATSVDAAEMFFEVALQNVRDYKPRNIDKIQMRFKRIDFTGFTT